MSDEKKYTLAEAAFELTRLECADNGHPPQNGVLDYGSTTAEYYLCECGAYKWVPHARKSSVPPVDPDDSEFVVKGG